MAYIAVVDSPDIAAVVAVVVGDILAFVVSADELDIDRTVG